MLTIHNFFILHVQKQCYLLENTFFKVFSGLTRGVNLGGFGVATPRFLAGGVVGCCKGGCGRVVKYYYIFSCTRSMFKSIVLYCIVFKYLYKVVTFEEK